MGVVELEACEEGALQVGLQSSVGEMAAETGQRMSVESLRRKATELMHDKSLALDNLRNLHLVSNAQLVAHPGLLITKAAAQCGALQNSQALRTLRIAESLAADDRQELLSVLALVRLTSLYALGRFQVVLKEYHATLNAGIKIGEAEHEIALRAALCSAQTSAVKRIAGRIREHAPVENLSGQSVEALTGAIMCGDYWQFIDEHYYHYSRELNEERATNGDKHLQELGLHLAHAQVMCGGGDQARELLTRIVVGPDILQNPLYQVVRAMVDCEHDRWPKALENLPACPATEQLSGTLDQGLYDWTRCLLLLASRYKREGVLAATQLLACCGKWGMTRYRNRAALLCSSAYLLIGDYGQARQYLDLVDKATMQHRVEHLHHIVIEALIAEGECGTQAAIELLEASEDVLGDKNISFVLSALTSAHDHLLSLLVRALGARKVPLSCLLLMSPKTGQRNVEAACKVLTKSEGALLRDRFMSLHTTEIGASRVLPHQLELFGHLSLTQRGQQVDLDGWAKSKARQMFLRVVLEAGCDVSRDALVGLLWPTMDCEKAANNYYVTWNAVKNIIEAPEKNQACPPMIRGGGGRLALDLTTCYLDIARFDELIVQGRECARAGESVLACEAYQQLAEIYRGDLLPGDDCFGWIAPYRERYRRQFSHAMTAAATISYQNGRFDEAQNFIEQVFRIGCQTEAVYDIALRILHKQRKRDEAIALYYQCADYLAETLGLDPTNNMKQLYGELISD